MKWVKRIKTVDGKLHDNDENAKRHANNEYHSQLTYIAHQLCKVGLKYEAIMDYHPDNP